MLTGGKLTVAVERHECLHVKDDFFSQGSILREFDLGSSLDIFLCTRFHESIGTKTEIAFFNK